jgi:multiple antibiotic resistance protein
MEALRIAGESLSQLLGSHCFQVNLVKQRVSKKVESDAQTRNDIALTPLAIPMLAGPGSISLLIAFIVNIRKRPKLLFLS